MKNTVLVLSAFLALCMLTLPAVSVRSDAGGEASSRPKSGAQSQPPNVDAEYFRVLDTTTDKVEKIPEAEYVWGVAAAEMGASYSPEALKAQIVAAYTLAVRARNAAVAAGAEYDLTNDYTKHQAFMTSAAAKSRWGNKFEEYNQKIKAALDEVQGLVLTYEGKPIFAAYHAISGGKTESAKNVWGEDYPYLRPVESVGDLMADGYLSTVKYTPEAFAERAKALDLNLKASDAAKFVAAPERSDSGTVLSYKLGGKNFTGAQMRNAFGLRSANFDLTYTEGELVFTVRGYGHGVGMSQHGAEYMARQGSTYDEILSWYYRGCKIEKYEDLQKKK